MRSRPPVARAWRVRIVRWLVDLLSPYAGLPAEEERLHAVLDQIPAMVARFDRSGRCVFVNERALQIYGLSLAQALGMRLSDLLSPQESALYAQHVPLVLSGRQQRARFEGSGQLAGKTIHYQVNLVPDRDAAGEIIGFFLMTFDISSLRAAQEQLARSEQRLRAITDNLPAVITYVDAEQRVQFANRNFRQWVGMRSDELIGKPFRDVAGAAAYDERQAALAQALGGERVSFEIETVVRDVPRCLQTLYVPDRDEHDSVRGIYTLTTDITELRAAEREMARLALSDPLTRLPNRRRLEERLPETLARARRQGTATGLLFLDVDHFKRINDGHGHAVGDAVLAGFSERLSRAVRSTDFVARFAGDEFVVILEGLADKAALEDVARKITRAMEPPLIAHGQALQVSTSIGGVFVLPGDERTPDGLLKAADQALYRTKARGRDGYTITAEPASDETAVVRA